MIGRVWVEVQDAPISSIDGNAGSDACSVTCRKDDVEELINSNTYAQQSI